jgi:hypothetical protein
MNTRTQWYDATLLQLLPKLNEVFTYYDGNDPMQKLIRSLLFKFKKLIFATNCVGIEYYFGTLKSSPIDPQKSLSAYSNYLKGSFDYDGFSGFVDPDSALIFFYHLEYTMSLITAICDNLALLTKHRYNQRLDPMRISLSKGSGDELLKEIRAKNVGLKNHIDKFRTFINLIYRFREKVIHQEGLDQGVAGPVPNYNNFVKIDNDIHNHIKMAGDQASKYRRISLWGVIDLNGQISVDPFLFIYQIFDKSVKLVEGYMTLLR